MNKDLIVVITGANSGIGKKAALTFAKEGYSVVMACRNLEKSKEVFEEILAETKNERVTLMELDVSSFDSIKLFCSHFKKQYEKLDILIHNAAYFNHGSPYQLSADNIELTYATNVFGPYLLTVLLLDHLKRSEDARILHASSNIVKHFFDEKKELALYNLLEEKKKHSVYEMYCNSKMALVILTFKMAEELKKENIMVNAIQINGAKMSKETLQKVTFGWRMIARVQNLFFPPTSYISDSYFHICTSEKLHGVTGQLINDKREIMEPASINPSLKEQIKQLKRSDVYPIYATKRETQQLVWDLCSSLTGRTISGEIKEEKRPSHIL
ncbi:SDR family NAD(P)-dependent oxidoreductase [Evansella cellulosilytica]|uniref:Short-chain dehydrogenase/reductase SDR n=1 Tax=Evansella cellulosilytica (strain ATCC 21833 / DSM 2522 / FERM P-1141 / JCM 9156 / N-4) TaxID=649639 RepID=E6TZC3_EVAC2|nr:SDR family NAD(P)-dependent oxidoreductase [Evansella cellulosilytica]ADU28985.1 short-chain dehydrogenase/reductase SDR [Evansella cellulosilytica DSM 2522]